MKQVTMLEMIDHLEKTIDLLKDAVRQTDYEIVSEPEAADAPVALCGKKTGMLSHFSCVCEKQYAHEGNCYCAGCGFTWSSENEADLSPETETPPVKVGDTVKRIADKNTSWTHVRLMAIGETGNVLTVDRGEGKAIKHNWSVLVQKPNGNAYWLHRDEYEVIPETQSAPKPEGMTVAELIGKLQNAPNQNAIIWISSIKAPSATPLKQAGHFRNDPAMLFLRDYLATGGTML